MGEPPTGHTTGLYTLETVDPLVRGVMVGEPYDGSARPRRTMFNSVVVGLKPGHETAAVVELARKVATPTTRLHLVAVVARADEAQARAAEAELAPLAQELSTDGYQATFEVRASEISVASELVEVLHDRDADLVVIGQRRRTAVGKAVMGSDAQRVLLGAPCPVLVPSTHG